MTSEVLTALENMLPKITHLQFLVLGSLASHDGKIDGCDLREKIADHGVNCNGPGFYQLMSRLERRKFVHGRYKDQVIDGQRMRQRVYRLMASGVRAVHETTKFYEQIIVRKF